MAAEANECPVLLNAAATRALVTKALVSAGHLQAETLVPAPDEADPTLIVRFPAWVGSFGILVGAEALWLWCEPRSDAEGTFPSQVVVDLPAGRYVIDTFDVAARSWISRESAPGGPLVAGLPFTGGPVLIYTRPIQ